ncbi:MAG: tetratricopeptide repeat protein, partial [Gemmatimonadetes bacterium]|nr:tetratricopeptide repeat protein [Gemmatimonadota bacterium]
MSEITTTVETTDSVGSTVASAVPSDTKEWFQTYGKYVVAGVAGVAALIAGIIFYTNNQATKEEEAALALSRVRSYVESGDYKKALDGDPSKKVRNNEILGLRQIVEEYG